MSHPDLPVFIVSRHVALLDECKNQSPLLFGTESLADVAEYMRQIFTFPWHCKLQISINKKNYINHKKSNRLAKNNTTF